MFDKTEFINNMEHGKDRLHLLKLIYLAAQLREQELKEWFNAAHTKVLQDNLFYVAINYERTNINIGDRIINTEHEFCMSEEDLERYLKLCNEETQRRRLTEKDGTYRKGCNGMMIKLEAENNLVDCQISLLPKVIREEFKNVKKNYVLKHKFLDIIMKGK